MDELWLRSSLVTGGLAPDLIEECSSGMLWYGIKLSAQDLFTELILTQRLGAFSRLNVATHHQAMGIFAAWVALQ